jgi:hypothetical protein
MPPGTLAERALEILQVLSLVGRQAGTFSLVVLTPPETVPQRLA